MAQNVWSKWLKTSKQTVQDKLFSLRKTIDLLDYDLINTLVKRIGVVAEIGKLKKEDQIAIFQIKRWFEMMNDRKHVGSKANLDEEFLHELFSIIHKYSVKTQTEILQRKD